MLVVAVLCVHALQAVGAVVAVNLAPRVQDTLVVRDDVALAADGALCDAGHGAHIAQHLRAPAPGPALVLLGCRTGVQSVSREHPACIFRLLDLLRRVAYSRDQFIDELAGLGCLGSFLRLVLGNQFPVKLLRLLVVLQPIHIHLVPILLLPNPAQEGFHSHLRVGRLEAGQQRMEDGWGVGGANRADRAKSRQRLLPRGH
mmetsp:Transcript_4581/g.10019  ORF Transcript_4581/g.10019 Transcript_4581/m.10019 type:complete len:201 (-) Transcript_4581:15-617(-)